ncbi:alpha-galactosidase [Olivibacter sp. SDN3]|uniref:alpha-galactosidase n=1 Tax=Olivibacter sp. SDN3 TaxID=2764720 RepID=UPI001650F3EF|nr:alpha-galactosidase [Olivibacter sp. SDN3]QNL50603.1 alpha-galactosidase [Olivibacter sp. SDN3]
MKHKNILFSILFLTVGICTYEVSEGKKREIISDSDWLLSLSDHKSTAVKSADNKDLIIQNGLLKRVFRLAPNVVCYDYTNMVTGQQLIRAVKPEARIQINGEWYDIGGLNGQKENAYFLPEWLDELTANTNSFKFEDYKIADLKPLLPWKADKWWATNTQAAKGKEVVFEYSAPKALLPGLKVKVHYAIYDGLPLLSKWITVDNQTGASIKINQIIHEQLAVVEEESAVVGDVQDMYKQHGIYVESNFAFNNAMRYHLSDQTTHWKRDTTYTSQVNYDLNTPALLEIYPEKGVGVELVAEEQLTSIRTWELLMDSYDRERRGLAIRKMYRTIAPWTTANPIFMHLVSKNDEQVKTAVDQCAQTGYEAVILSFGSHIDMEDTTAENIARWRNLADYAHQQGVKIGGYSLFSSRKISEKHDVINPKTGKTGGAFFDNAPCFGSEWGIAYSQKIKTFFKKTGFDIWENDGPYPGDQCASTTHPGHQGLDDSQWKQLAMQKDLYHWLNERGVYINAPDWYFLDGSNKIALGYREVNFALPRENQQLLNRQNIYDGTWEQTPAMGWGFVPLTAYHGGGPEAVLEPLADHLDDYKQLMMQYYGAGIQACYRGPRLYDTEETKETVVEVINWYKQYREILNADIIHLRRADGRDWDGIFHVNPNGEIKGLAMLYNPLKEAIKRKIKLPLYYTGAEENVKISQEGEATKNYELDRSYHVELEVEIPAEGYSWLAVE